MTNNIIGMSVIIWIEVLYLKNSVKHLEVTSLAGLVSLLIVGILIVLFELFTF